MECHCKDHLPGDWHSNGDCDCSNHDHPTYSFVVTKVMEEDPGTPTVYISKPFFESLQIEEGDALEIVGSGGNLVRARAHPNPWIDTRMISIDRHTMEKIGCSLFGQVKLRKACCAISERVALEVPAGTSVTRRQLQDMLDRAQGALISEASFITLKDGRNQEYSFRIVECQPAIISRISKNTHIELKDPDGDHHVAKEEVTFADVGGLQDAIRKVIEVVRLPLQHPEIFTQLGIDPPRGVLLHGPSGTGKTLIARAVAGETGCYFKAVNGSEIMDKHYGESEAKLRTAFEEAYKAAPAIIFIDEIDALAPRRDTAEGEVERRVTAQLLALMDGLDDRGNVIVLAATNLPNVLDSALRRAGRFDREILIGVPNKTGRKEILEIHTRDMPLAENVDLTTLAEKTHGYVGADIKALCQEAGYKALRRILPGLEDTQEKLTNDFLEVLTVEAVDFDSVLSELQPSSARIFEVDLSKAGWDYIAGYAEEIDFLKEMVLWPLQNLPLLSSLEVDHLGAMVISGPSGVGKTLIARSLAKESGFNVIEIRGPELISKYMGESERNVRELFRQARQIAPAVVILDGVDAMTTSGWSDSKLMDRIVNQLVLEMNAIGRDQPILVVATCSRAEDLPPALRATGRFATELNLKRPDLETRKRIFDMYLRKEQITFEGSLDKPAADAEGFTAGDIAEVCRRTILHAAKRASKDHLEHPLDVKLSEDDVVKMIDRIKLAGGIRGGS